MFFKDVIGQTALKQRLIRSVQEQRISHAQLFLGSEGSGNLALALAYARYVLCANRSETDACGTCSSCQKLNQLAHPDLHMSMPIMLSSKTPTSDYFLPQFREQVAAKPYGNLQDWYDALGEGNKQGVIAAKEADDIVRKLSLKAFEGGYKILVMWMPEQLNIAAANKLLKIIEEPPENTLFLLAGSDMGKLLTTIISRLQLVKLDPLEDREIAAALVANMGLQEAQATSISRLAAGNYREAMVLAQDRTEEGFNFSTFRNWMRFCFTKDVVGVTGWVDEVATVGRERQKQLLHYGLHIFRQCMVGNYAGADMVRLDGQELDFSRKFAPFIKGANIIQLSEALNEAYHHLERNASPKVLFLDLSFKIFALLNK